MGAGVNAGGVLCRSFRRSAWERSAPAQSTADRGRNGLGEGFFLRLFYCAIVFTDTPRSVLPAARLD